MMVIDEIESGDSFSSYRAIGTRNRTLFRTIVPIRSSRNRRGRQFNEK